MAERHDGSVRFSPAQLDALDSAGRHRLWRSGEVLMRQGTPPTDVVLVREGLAKVTADSSNGYTSVLALRGPGELLGELSCVDDRPRSATVTAVGRTSGVVVSAAHFRRLLAADGTLALAVLRSVVLRLRDSDRLRAEHGAYPAVVRVARVLRELAERHGSKAPRTPGGLAVRITQQELAGAAGTSRETVVRALRLLQADGLVLLGRGLVTVTASTELAVWTVR